MPVSNFKDRHGLSGQQINCLSHKWCTIKDDREWEDFNTFIYWSAFKGYTSGMHLVKIDPNQPHGPHNSVWSTKDRIPLPESDRTGI